MCGSKRFWMILIVLALLAVSGGCTENNLDESDANVVLAVISSDTSGAVEPGATTGVCSLDAGIQCLDDSTCSDQAAGNCELSVEILCVLPQWEFDFEVLPLNEGAELSPLNNVEIVAVDVVYTGGLVIPDRTLDVGIVVPVGSAGSHTFEPVNTEDITSDDTSVTLAFTWRARTLGGDSVDVQGGGGATLQIQDCLP